MQKPKSPKKPSKNEPHPSEFANEERIIMRKSDGGFSLLEPESIFYDQEAGEWSYEKDGLEKFGEDLNFNELAKIKELLGLGFDNFTIRVDYCRDGYYENTVIFYKRKKSEMEYADQINSYLSRFERYELELKNYNTEMEKYKEYLKDSKLAKLKKKLHDLEKGK